MKKAIILLVILLLSGCTQESSFNVYSVKDVVENHFEESVIMEGTIAGMMLKPDGIYNVRLTDNSGYEVELTGMDSIRERLENLAMNNAGEIKLKVEGAYTQDPDSKDYVFWVNDVEKV